MKIEYLLFNIIVFLPAFLGKIIFFKRFFLLEKQLLKSIIIVGLIFIIKDLISVNFFWRFNDQYILGLKFLGLPIEELMFFFTVPYSTLFVYMIVEDFFPNKKIVLKPAIFILISIIFFLVMFYSLNNNKLYLFYITFFYYLTLMIIRKKLSFNLIRFYLVIFILTLIFNFYLTARPVVIYNNDYLVGLKVGTIPVEDFLYSFSLFNLLLYFFKFKRINK